MMKKRTGNVCLAKWHQAFWMIVAAVLTGVCAMDGYAAGKGEGGYVAMPSGVQCRMADGRMRVEFVTPDIVRVRYTREADFLGNANAYQDEMAKRGSNLCPNVEVNVVQIWNY